MEVATTNNHNQSHHHNNHHKRMPAHHSLNSLNNNSNNNISSSNNNNNNTLAIGNEGNNAAAAPPRSPFQREVREWQRIDPDTGALLTGRLEADRWINGPMNSYGKISDSQNISQPNGTQHTQRKQLEVLQSRTVSGAMQVIRAQTVQTTSSRWSSSNSSPTSPIMANQSQNQHSTSNNLFNNHNNINSNNNNTSTNNNHLHSPLLHLTNSNDRFTHWPKLTQMSQIPQISSKVDICEVLSDDDSTDDYDHHQHSLFNDVANSLNNHNSNSLLLDTAPSLKLSNLMKSSSSISSNNSSSNNSIKAAAAAETVAMKNTHNKSAGKISLHAIVGNNNNNNVSNNDDENTTNSPATTWKRSSSSRRFEQPALYGNNSSNNKNLAKSRVGSISSDSSNIIGDSTAVTTFTDELRHHSQRSAELTPTQLKQQARRDLESFGKHYNEHNHAIALSASNDDDDNCLRLSTRHQRRQQFPSSQAATLQRSHSISTDDLSSEWDTYGDDPNEEPTEWRRVSKLRRSFQSTTTTSSDYNKSALAATRRPIDLPTSSVSVSRIRAELENGRRLNTAMRSNNLDLAALDTLLNTRQSDMKPTPAKRTTFLTAESLKEIRGKLKRLSDESLYKEDYMTQQEAPPLEEEQVEVQYYRRKSPEPLKLRQFTAEESSKLCTSPKSSAFHVVKRSHPAANATIPQSSTQKHTTNSLESRQKPKDTNSAEWHIRRKSYGFEKMSPPADKSMFRMDASTDSGLGRSGELGNWSPTEPNATSSARNTVVRFREPANVASNMTALQRYRHLSTNADDAEDESESPKRHSIAVDDSQYVHDNLRKTTQVRLNGFSESLEDGTTRYESMESSSSSMMLQRNQQKRVEFCKTEVHFAAESGRVNIVETDGKPPPTNNFRRRRRTTSGPLQSLVKSASTISSSNASNTSSSVALPITHFGDDHCRKTITSSTVAYKASLVDDTNAEAKNVTVSTPKRTESYMLTENTRNSYTSTSGVDTTDNENDEISTIRGILKNKPVKPKPYHLGENFDTADGLWGVQLKPVGLANSLANNEVSHAEQPTSVAERVRIAEKRHEPHANSYSTKINLSLGERRQDVHNAGVQNIGERRLSAQELMLQDLREHQRILDEGLKSTSLIIKTMRSASEFDEAMRRLSIASLEAAVIPPIVVPTPMLRSNSYQEPTRRYSTNSLESCTESENMSRSTQSTTTATSSMTIARRYSSGSSNLIIQPIKAPRLKLIGSTEVPVSQQLTQLRRMYDMAATQEDDSADEEVKSYFRAHNENSDSGGGTLESSSLEDMHSAEYSSSWSRLKAKRTIWKIDTTNEQKPKQILERAEVPTSNVMNIELHSPQTTYDKYSGMQRTQTPPIAKPRTIKNVQEHEHPKVQTAISVKQATDPMAESLTIIKEARGARKLREHELSYFGVPAYDDVQQEKIAKPTKFISPKRTLPQRKTSVENTTTKHYQNEVSKEKQTTKWHLINDKPDLLRHSPIVVEPQIITRTAEIKSTERQNRQRKQQQHSPIEKVAASKISERRNNEPESEDEDEEHFYENITNELTPVFKVKSPTTVMSERYDRKTDLKRDAMILCEMNTSADQTLRAISDEAALKDKRRRSLQRRNSKPLETIAEKSATAEKVMDTCIAVKVSRSTLASEAKRSARHLTPSPTTVTAGRTRVRTSSQSSVESSPRAGRSRSLSSERECENVRIKSKPATKSKYSKHSKSSAGNSRSSSRESQRSSHAQCSSGDEEHFPSQHVRSSSATSGQRKEKHLKRSEHIRKDKYQSSSQPDERRHHTSHAAVSSKTQSSQRERVKNTVEPSHHRSQRASELTSSGRARKEHDESTATTHRSSGEKHERTTRSSGSGLTRSLRAAGHEHEKSRSSHRTEHGTEKDKEKLSGPKGHSNRSTLHHSERTSTTQRVSTATPTKLREHKKSSRTSESKQQQHHHQQNHHENAEQYNDNIMTHSKNPLILNGHHQQHHNHAHQQHSQHIEHSMTTATIAAKHRERHGKDRK